MDNPLEKLAVGEPAFPMSKYGDDDFNKMAAGTKYLPRIMLIGSNSGLAIEGKVMGGNYALMMQSGHKDLGAAVDVLVLAWRPRAMDTSGDEVVSVFDPESEVFKKIQQQSELKDSGCFWGPEFLVYIKEVKEYATYFMSSKTARREAPNMRALVHKAATLKSQLIDPPKSKYKWHGPVVVACSTPFEIPEIDELKEQAEKFINPPTEEREVVKEGEKRDR